MLPQLAALSSGMDWTRMHAPRTPRPKDGALDVCSALIEDRWKTKHGIIPADGRNRHPAQARIPRRKAFPPIWKCSA